MVWNKGHRKIKCDQRYRFMDIYQIDTVINRIYHLSKYISIFKNDYKVREFLWNKILSFYDHKAIKLKIINKIKHNKNKISPTEN